MNRITGIAAGLLSLMGALTLPGTASADVIYAATGGGSPGSLYTIDGTTGAATLVGSLLDAAGAPYALTGLAFDPISGALYGSTTNNSPTFGRALVIVDPLTALVTQVGGFGIGTTCADITFSAAGGLYCWPAAVQSLYTVNTATGLATIVPGSPVVSGSQGGGLAFDLGGTLYSTPDGASGSPHLNTVDPSNGTPTNVGNLGARIIAGMDVGSDDVLYGVDTDRGSGAELFVSIDKTTAAVTTIGSTGVSPLDALAIQRETVPEPATLALLGLGLAGLGFARRRTLN